ncbi:hypothetical protein ASZ90_009641 [hydrocarbon metagenome]|uniref:Uncharacterized protein n=1 Tax=hydrocarbon metagenome TaxID=938273 RepID=A0A0W8FIA3_9ZZZZ
MHRQPGAVLLTSASRATGERVWAEYETGERHEHPFETQRRPAAGVQGQNIISNIFILCLL